MTTYYTSSDDLVTTASDTCRTTEQHYNATPRNENRVAPPWERLIESFGTLSQGWDGYAAPPPTPIALEEATRLVQTMEECQLKPDRIAPSVAGGVGITISHADGRMAYIEVYNDATTYVMYSKGDADPDVFPVRTTGEKERRGVVVRARKYLGR